MADDRVSCRAVCGRWKVQGVKVGKVPSLGPPDGDVWCRKQGRGDFDRARARARREINGRRTIRVGPQRVGMMAGNVETTS